MLGCYPFSDDEDIREFINETNKISALSSNYKKKPIDEVEDYIPYDFASLKDPFKIKEFALDNNDVVSNNDNCDNNYDCGNPPEKHVRGLLEIYELSSFSLVGVINDDKNNNVALVKNPDLGVVPIKKGEYIGKKDGLVVSVDDNKVIIREKLFDDGKWKDIRKTLVIK